MNTPKTRRRDSVNSLNIKVVASQLAEEILNHMQDVIHVDYIEVSMAEYCQRTLGFVPRFAAVTAIAKTAMDEVSAFVMESGATPIYFSLLNQYTVKGQKDTVVSVLIGDQWDMGEWEEEPEF